jgi:hypothetical protein
MNFATLAKMAFIAGFVALSLSGQPFAAQAEGAGDTSGGGGDILVFDILGIAETREDLTTVPNQEETARPVGGGGEFTAFDIVDAMADSTVEDLTAEDGGEDARTGVQDAFFVRNDSSTVTQ